MLRTHRNSAFAAVALALLAVPSLPGQFTLPRGSSQASSNPSHYPLKGVPATAGNAEDLLRNRLSTLEALKGLDLQRLKARLLANPKYFEQFQGLAKGAGGKAGAIDPELRAAIQKLVGDFTQGEHRPLDPEMQKRLAQSLLDQARKGEFSKLPRTEPPQGRPRRNGLAGERMPDVPKTPAPTPPVRPRERPDNQAMAQYASRAANWLNRMGVNTEFTRSATWQRLVEGLNDYARGERGGPESADSWFRRLGLDLNPSRWFSSESWPFRMQLPRVPLPNFSRMVPSFPQGGGFAGTPEAPSGGVWRGLLWLLLGLALCGAGWLLLSRRKGIAAGADDLPERRLGPWPVRPEDVRSPDDLIRAFEYLSLLRIGFEAQSWNHHQIAAALAPEPAKSEQTHAARALAGAYEQVRYAPPQHLLSAAELEAARRHLCLLAGVAAA